MVLVWDPDNDININIHLSMYVILIDSTSSLIY